jgi:hypothetical protein
MCVLIASGDLFWAKVIRTPKNNTSAITNKIIMTIEARDLFEDWLSMMGISPLQPDIRLRQPVHAQDSSITRVVSPPMKENRATWRASTSTMVERVDNDRKHHGRGSICFDWINHPLPPDNYPKLAGGVGITN